VGADATQKPVVIFGHGNGEVIDYWLTALHGFRERGIGVLLVEWSIPPEVSRSLPYERKNGR
jgi:hypothetical protein